MKNVFEKIIDGELPCDKVFENERILAFKDIHPVAPVHIIIVPKKAIANLSAATSEDAQIIGEIALVAKDLAKKFNIEKGYRLLTNNGSDSGQTIFHLHFHLIGGRPLSIMG